MVLDAAGLDDAARLAIAVRVGYSETAFAESAGSSGQYRIRYFSPKAEVAFCGHATIATAVAIAGPVLAEDPGPIGRLVRGGAASPLVEGALPSLPPPVRSLRLADAFSPSDDDIPQEPDRPARPSPAAQDTDE